MWSGCDQHGYVCVQCVMQLLRAASNAEQYRKHVPCNCTRADQTCPWGNYSSASWRGFAEAKLRTSIRSVNRIVIASDPSIESEKRVDKRIHVKCIPLEVRFDRKRRICGAQVAKRDSCRHQSRPRNHGGACALQEVGTSKQDMSVAQINKKCLAEFEQISLNKQGGGAGDPSPAKLPPPGGEVFFGNTNSLTLTPTPTLTLLYYTILYYTILYYTILYTILYYTILYCIILYYTIVYYTILYYTILYYTIGLGFRV